MIAVTRSFQRGATFETFDEERFISSVVKPIKKLLSNAPCELTAVAVVSCVDQSASFCEQSINGETPTLIHLDKHFKNEILNGLIIPVACHNWGLNAGSATAINDGIAAARTAHTRDILVWSPEFDLDGEMLRLMRKHKSQHGLGLVGYLRENWHLRTQWTFPQNTCALWSKSVIDAAGGFNPNCNGDGKRSINSPEFGNIPLAGMEDFEMYLRATKQASMQWGVVGARRPAKWDVSLYKPGTKEFMDNAKKVARQGLVMNAYINQHFPGQDLIDVYSKILSESVNEDILCMPMELLAEQNHHQKLVSLHLHSSVQLDRPRG